ncbi:hypothetical protein L202_02654 [Cryptococcus amylolentus CBS 6039]|uniref:Uncharacterized protein n=2 Tax=Cryptococcus amylolentus TaxID=104669 RepID=A0A1E3HVQ8_9TREE|nr:hypothetical protein L202_02654 [Cryptococcus amylolentus CBS 6039]ODN80402.1 hypothetical protein L202_02654 [Cryptococcus amylolentus CBS 6039]ODO09033.1 hypothetical protein I350_02631 [Cryptococcus amylolentus CBS 6273]
MPVSLLPPAIPSSPNSSSFIVLPLLSNLPKYRKAAYTNCEEYIIQFDTAYHKIMRKLDARRRVVDDEGVEEDSDDCSTNEEQEEILTRLSKCVHAMGRVAGREVIGQMCVCWLVEWYLYTARLLCTSVFLNMTPRDRVVLHPTLTDQVYQMVKEAESILAELNEMDLSNFPPSSRRRDTAWNPKALENVFVRLMRSVDDFYMGGVQVSSTLSGSYSTLLQGKVLTRRLRCRLFGTRL